jgi:hypothetical protein
MSEPVTPRQIVAAQIQTDNTSFTVKDFPTTPTEVRDPYIVVWRSDVEEAETPLALKHTLTINAYGARTVGAEAEAALDDLLDALMISLQRIPGFVLDKAERSTFADTFHGWKITGHVHTENYPRSTVIGE